MGCPSLKYVIIQKPEVMKRILFVILMITECCVSSAQDKPSYIGAFKNEDGSGIMITGDRYYYVTTINQTSWFPSNFEGVVEGICELMNGQLALSDDWGYEAGAVLVSPDNPDAVFLADLEVCSRMWQDGLFDSDDNGLVVKDLKKVISQSKRYVKDASVTRKMDDYLEYYSQLKEKKREEAARITKDFISQNSWILGLWKSKEGHRYLISYDMVKGSLSEGVGFENAWVPTYHRVDYEDGARIQHELWPSTELTEDGLIIDLEHKEISSMFSEYYLKKESSLSSSPIFLGNASHDFQSWIGAHLQYPAAAIENDVSGVVRVQFTINQDGKVVDVCVIESVDPLVDKAAVQVVQSSPAWIPAFRDGQYQSVTYAVGITFGFR